MRTILIVAFTSLVVGASALLAEPGLDRIDAAVEEAIARRELPGAVVLILHKGQVIYRKAFGHRSLVPDQTLMGADTVFDLASLTKPIVTATALMLLLEEGKLSLKDKLADHIPAFRRKETEAITLEHLLLHTSGFIADNPVADYEKGRPAALERLHALSPTAPPGIVLHLQRCRLHSARRSRGKGKPYAARRIRAVPDLHPSRHERDGLSSGRRAEVPGRTDRKARRPLATGRGP